MNKIEELINIKKAIFAQVILFLENNAEVLYKSDGMHFSIIKDIQGKVFFIAKSETTNKLKEFTKDQFNAEELMDGFAEFTVNILSEEYRDIPPANSKSDIVSS